MLKTLAFSLCVFALAACSSKPSTPEENLRYYKVGNPYRINSEWYHPKEDPYYDATGMASWYGPGFHGRKTANGEEFDKYDMTAAHPTLPMPSMVRVTNLENGRSVELRVNDRGPFKSKRIIDVSKKAADRLGFLAQGIAKVRVQFLPEETAELFGGVLPSATREKALATNKTDRRPAPLPVPEPAYEEVVQNPEPETYPLEEENLEGTSASIQAGAFRLRENARRVADELSRFGVAQIVEIDQEGGRLYAVRVSGFRTMQEASRILRLVQQLGYQDALLLSKN